MHLAHIKARLSRKMERLAHRERVGRDEDLIDDLRPLPGTRFALAQHDFA